MKKLLAALLTLALSLTLALPTAFAEEGETGSQVNWDDFYIVTQPVASLSMFSSDTVTLRIEVNIPEGVEVGYQWRYSGVIPDATEPVLTIGPDDWWPRSSDEPTSGPSAGSWSSRWPRRTEISVWCIITAYEKEDDAIVTSRELRSDAAQIMLKGNMLENLYDLFISEPARFARLPLLLWMGQIMIWPLWGLLILLSPFTLALALAATPFAAIYAFFNTLYDIIRVANLY